MARAAGAAFFCWGAVYGAGSGRVGADVFYGYGEMGLVEAESEWGVVACGPDG